MQEHRTAERIVQELEASSIPTCRISETRVLAIVENGEGPTVAARADIDGLPVKEASGKSYASTATQVDKTTGRELPVAHACGHDFHLMSLLSAIGLSWPACARHLAWWLRGNSPRTSNPRLIAVLRRSLLPRPPG